MHYFWIPFFSTTRMIRAYSSKNIWRYLVVNRPVEYPKVQKIDILNILVPILCQQPDVDILMATNTKPEILK
jgi:hypothetical protein